MSMPAHVHWLRQSAQGRRESSLPFSVFTMGPGGARLTMGLPRLRPDGSIVARNGAHTQRPPGRPFPPKA